MTGSDDKASRYISSLDAARVNASWAELPELIRKVNKHAPQRKILTQTAAAEHDIATFSGHEGDLTKSQSLTALSATLQTEGNRTSEDVFQGKSALLWATWLGPTEGRSATSGFDTVTAIRELGSQSLSTWTKICIVKSAYIEGTIYLRNGRPSEAQKIFSAAITNIESSRELVLSTPQLAYWSEQLLAQAALGAHKQAEGSVLGAIGTDAFKYWTLVATKTREVPASTFKNSTSHPSRLTVWRTYYEYLSADLRRHSVNSRTTDTATRLQKSTTLRQAERAYESELLRVTMFPRAAESNAVVEGWVEQAVQNWQILCGSQWRDADLGEGGRDVVGRGMLHILYRAATKTFHSTLILRRLFQVHKSLGEFDLAYRAFDTYIELVERGRIRVAKSKKAESGQESDELVLLTIAEAITGLCTFGRQLEAHKGYNLCVKLEDWLVTIGVESGDLEEDEGITQNGHVTTGTDQTTIAADTLQVVYRAIGCGKAHWARWTPASEHRSELQEEALTSLQKACSHGQPATETLYATALLLAETRDIAEAVKYAKRALTKSTAVNSQSPTFASERKLIPLWHLLALLLSSRQDLDSATKSCIAAFEQFIPNNVPLPTTRSSSTASEITIKEFDDAVARVANEFEFEESERIIEVRITELALSELTEGPEEAVNCSNELLSLFAQLFAGSQISVEAPAVTRTLVPPKSSAGTVKSSRHSIFGRRRHPEPVVAIREKDRESTSLDTDTTRPSTRATQAPTIQVTNEDEKPGSKGHHHFRHSLDSSHSKSSVDGGSRKGIHRLGHRSHKEARHQNSVQAQAERPIEGHTGTLETVPDDRELPTPVAPLVHEESETGKQELPAVSHNLGSHDEVPPPASHDDQPPQQDVRLPNVNRFTTATSLPPRFPKAMAQKQALVLLTKVWLVIAMLYRRASMFDDSKEACEEASKSAAKIEALVGATDQSARAFAAAGWGAGSKSADEVWADVYCERAELWLAIYNHKVQEGQATSNDELRSAIEQYEQCLMFVPNHSAGIIGLSNVLLDYFEKKIDVGRWVNDGRSYLAEQDEILKQTTITTAGVLSRTHTNTSAFALPLGGTSDASHVHLARSSAPTQNLSSSTCSQSSGKAEDDHKKTPENLNRIAARDRAYGLLSTLTRLGSGWDNSEAWFALARAHELGGEIEKAKSVLWWCVELEDTRPIRHWRNLGYGM